VERASPVVSPRENLADELAACPSWVSSYKAPRDYAEEKLCEDKRFEVSGQIPFDAKHLTLGCLSHSTP
jgi:hypothetical protein